MVRYKFIRLPVPTFNLYKNVKIKMENDLTRIYGKPKRLTMTKVFRAVIDPALNENYIQIDLGKLNKYARKKRGYYV